MLGILCNHAILLSEARKSLPKEFFSDESEAENEDSDYRESATEDFSESGKYLMNIAIWLITFCCLNTFHEKRKCMQFKSYLYIVK